MNIIPTVENKNGFLEGIIELNYWNAFFEKEAVIGLNIGGDSPVDEINQANVIGYEYIVNNQKLILNAVLKNLLSIYSEMQEEYGYDEEEKNHVMPDISSITDLKKLLIPKRIYILNTQKSEMPYIGYHFLCTWDEENDFGVMMFEDRVVETGGADTAFLSWIAEKDINKDEGN